MAKRKTSDSVKKMRLIILGIALALVVVVVGLTWYTLSRESENGQIQWTTAEATTATTKIAGQPDETTTAPASTASDVSATTNVQGLPYDTSGSDLYAEFDGKHPSAEVIVKKDSNGKWAAFVKDKLATDATGVYCNEYGWWFVRNGYVDFNYTGIAGNEKGKWYITRGKADFSFTGTYTPTGATHHYTVIEGNVVRETNI